MIRHAWRIVKEKYRGSAFTGEGASRTGGRWNSRGTRIVYASGTLALAALETLVHLNPPILLQYVAIRAEFDSSLVETFSLSLLAAHWTEEPPPQSTQWIGDSWIKEARSAVLELPSVIVPGESNYLLNPAHPGFKKIIIGKPSPFAFDPRLLT